jgi:hypothetical protein
MGHEQGASVGHGVGRGERDPECVRPVARRASASPSRGPIPPPGDVRVPLARRRFTV